jgi:preprotein translocase subunit Sec63
MTNKPGAFNTREVAVNKDPYEILGVQRSDSAGEIQKAYRRLAVLTPRMAAAQPR